MFFGARTGTVANAMIEPTDALRKRIEPAGGRLVLFVDVAFILALRREMKQHSELGADYDAVCRHVAALAKAGHEIQLHIHTHWEDCHWRDGRWHMAMQRYKLHDFDDADILRLVGDYVTVLREIAGPEHAYAYRAGGWVIQPFDRIKAALAANGVTIDSTVFAGGVAEDTVHLYDFTRAPRHRHWRFEDDPCVPVDGGTFLEVPIASIDVWPDFYWKFAWQRKFGGHRHQAFGKGSAVPLGRMDLIKKLASRTTSVVSMDGYKAALLERAHRTYAASGAPSFVIIGHPKAFTPYSLDALTEFLTPHRMASVTTFAPFAAPVARAA